MASMKSPASSHAGACADIEAAIAQLMTLLAARGVVRPLVVALDGPSGAGKSTLAAQLMGRLAGEQVGKLVEVRVGPDLTGAVVVPLDDFFAAGIPDGAWDARAPAERLRDVFEWARVRVDVLEPLRAGRAARWHPFDFGAGLRADGTYGMSETPVVREPAAVVLLEGAYSAAAPLADLVDLAVLVEVPAAARRRRLAAREEAAFLAQWHARWDPVEALYFGAVRPPGSFDLVVSGE
jgi:uridine kinase